MDLILTDDVLRLSKALELDTDQLLSCETADELISLIQAQLDLELPENPWSLQYAAEQTDEFASKVETDYTRRQRQYGAVYNLIDQTGVIRYVKNLLLIELLRLACLRRYESIEQAQAVKIRIRDQVSAVMLDSSDAMYMLWRDWKTLLIEAIEQQEETLPHVQYISRAVSLPAIVISYQQYGNIDREQDILDRNGIIHPFFCPPGRNLEVLSQ